MSPVRTSLSRSQARRVALAAQGFADPRPLRPDRRALRRVLGRVGIIQIDSVNVLCRSQYLPLYSRLGPYPQAMLDRASNQAPRLLFEYWAHEASLVPVQIQPLLRWRMDSAADAAWGGMWRIAVEQPEFATWVLDEVRHIPPHAASAALPMRQRSNGWICTGTSDASCAQYSNSRRGAWLDARSNIACG